MDRVLLCDLGNVVLFFSHDRMWEQIAGVCGWEPRKLRDTCVEAGIPRRLELGRMTSEEFQQWLEELTGKKLDKEALRQASGDIFTPNEPMIELLKELKGRGVRIIVVSNTCEPHIDFIEKNFDVLELFDDHVYSFRIRAAKPDARIFREAVKRAGGSAERCFYVDDVSAYVDAASVQGIDGVVFGHVDSLRDELVRRGMLS